MEGLIILPTCSQPRKSLAAFLKTTYLNLRYFPQAIGTDDLWKDRPGAILTAGLHTRATSLDPPPDPPDTER